MGREAQAAERAPFAMRLIAFRHGRSIGVVSAGELFGPAPADIVEPLARKLDAKMTKKPPPRARRAARFGRATSSPPQFGQTCSIASAQAGQNVHSNEQIVASASSDSAAPQRSQVVLISKPTRA